MTVVLDVLGEGVECAANEARRAIGVSTGSPAIDEVGQSADLADARVISAVIRECGEQSCQPREAGATGAALACALIGEVVGDCRSAGQSALMSAERMHDAHP